MLAIKSSQFKHPLLEAENLPNSYKKNLHFKMKHEIPVYLFEIKRNPSGACRIYAHCLMTF